jgi:hypothetical protein
VTRARVLLLALCVLALLSLACWQPPTVTVQDGADGITTEELDDLYTVLIQPTEEAER